VMIGFTPAAELADGTAASSVAGVAQLGTKREIRQLGRPENSSQTRRIGRETTFEARTRSGAKRFSRWREMAESC
jgi:hypothetical protein